MPIIRITSLTHPGVEIFSMLTEAQLRRDLEPGQGIFIAESPKVIRVALDAGYTPLALLCEERHIVGDAADIILRHPEIPVYTEFVSPRWVCRVGDYKTIEEADQAMRMLKKSSNFKEIVILPNQLINILL